MKEHLAKEFDKKLSKVRNATFPMKLHNGFSCDLMDELPFMDFLKKNFTKVFPKNKDCIHFDLQTLSKIRSRNRSQLFGNYSKVHHDYIIFYDKNKNPVGWTCGESEDCETYYMRNTGIFNLNFSPIA